MMVDSVCLYVCFWCDDPEGRSPNLVLAATLRNEIIKGQVKGKPTRWRRKCYMIWHMMLALLHLNGQLGTERYGDTEKGCQKPAVQQKTTDERP